jgi:hypothetical protein
MAVARRTSRSFVLASLRALHLDLRLLDGDGRLSRKGKICSSRLSVIEEVGPKKAFTKSRILEVGPSLACKWGQTSRL